ncbi:hypothetical protein Vretifemale_6121 [Volvox reticuliferus]|uniref:Uncharacterized protein n=1 Tax=Volvox reticuliferus TaxID=1737510 RepID=A0A8J4C868_9CHLO|nr:hypothetical protein Vretifemale_6121 [Volvox reticuliferus]
MEVFYSFACQGTNRKGMDGISQTSENCGDAERVWHVGRCCVCWVSQELSAQIGDKGKGPYLLADVPSFGNSLNPVGGILHTDHNGVEMRKANPESGRGYAA